MASRPASIKVRALQWLAQREHSRSELRLKLLRLVERRAPAPAEAQDPAAHLPDRTAPALSPASTSPTAAEEVDALLDGLEAAGYLSSRRFVESRVHTRQARYGNLRIARELQQHGLGLDAQAQQALKDSELDRARQVWRKKYGQPAADMAGRLRQMRFLAGRGFSADVIRRVVRCIDDDLA
jgi:regulatory protein